MPFDFNIIPAGGIWRAPGTLVEFVPGSSAFDKLYKSVIFAPQLASALATPNVPVPVPTAAEALAQFGRGSLAASMAVRYLSNNLAQPLWVVPLAEANGARAQGAVTLTGTASESGTLYLAVGARLLKVPVQLGDSAAVITTRLAAAVSADPDAFVSAHQRWADRLTLASPGSGYTTATVTGPAGTQFQAVITAGAISQILIVDPGADLPQNSYSLTITGDGTGAAASITVASQGLLLLAKQRGAILNDLALQLNPAGRDGEQVLPGGLNIALTDFAGGSGTPDYAPAIAALGDEPFDWWAWPDTDAATMDLIEAELAARWNWDRQSYALGFCARRGTLGDTLSYAHHRNSPYLTRWSERPGGSPTPIWDIAAAFLGQCAASLSNDPAQSLTTLPLVGVTPPPVHMTWSQGERNQLYFSGSAAGVLRDTVYRIDRPVTEYTVNELGQADPSYLDIQTPACLKYFAESLLNTLSQLRRMKLVNDDTAIPTGAMATKPTLVKSLLIAHYKNLETQLIVQDSAKYAQSLIVEIDAQNPTMLKIHCEPALVSPLLQLGIQVKFFLQF